MIMKKLLTFVLLTLLTTTALATTLEDIPDISAYNWHKGDDFSDLNYSLNNWSTSLPSDIRFGISTSGENGYLRGNFTSTSKYGTITPTQSDDIIGIRADMRLASLSLNSTSASYCAIGIDITSYASLYWGFAILNGQLQGGRLLLYQNGSTNIIDGVTDFNAVIGQTYNLAMVFDDNAKEYYLYLNDQKITNVYFPDNDSSFLSANFRMYTRNTTSQVEFDNIEFATVPEPSAIFVLGLGGLLIKKYKSIGGKR